MGSITSVDLEQAISLFNLLTFVETGLLYGDGVRAALDAGFENVVSIDINEEYCKAVKQGIPDSRLTVYYGDSLSVLPEVTPTLDGNVFWWLDAHLPHLYGNPDISEYSLVYPLISELEFISGNRDCSRDVFLLDDIWFYQDMTPSIKWAEGKDAPISLDLVPTVEKLLPSHYIYTHYADQGYMLVFPINDGVPDGFCIGWNYITGG